MEKRNLEELEQNIGYKFTNIKLLQNALTHTSYAYEHGKKSNEKLEFLGDSILEFVSSEYMYNKYLNLKTAETKCFRRLYYLTSFLINYFFKKPAIVGAFVGILLADTGFTSIF